MKKTDTKYETNRGFNEFIFDAIKKYTEKLEGHSPVVTSYSLYLNKKDREYEIDLNYILLDNLMDPEDEAERNEKIVLSTYEGQQLMSLICEEYTIPFHTERLFVALYDPEKPLVVSVDYMVKKRRK